MKLLIVTHNNSIAWLKRLTVSCFCLLPSSVIMRSSHMYKKSLIVCHGDERETSLCWVFGPIYCQAIWFVHKIGAGFACPIAYSLLRFPSSPTANYCCLALTSPCSPIILLLFLMSHRKSSVILLFHSSIAAPHQRQTHFPKCLFSFDLFHLIFDLIFICLRVMLV